MRPFMDGIPRPLPLNLKVSPELLEGVRTLAEIDHVPIAFEGYLLLKQCVQANQQRINEYNAMMKKFRQSPKQIPRQPIMIPDEESDT